ncbi:MAG TPA: TolC family outer membrane protein [Burkholderiales bacterium]|nr:TolC family outer membrane protein [Burkholderiales bacterium]
MKKFLTALTALAISPAAGAADLLEVYREALSQDSQYAAAKAQYQAVQERLPQAKAGLLPFVNVTGDLSEVDLKDGPSDTSKGYQINASQPLFRMQNYAAYEQAKHVVQQAEVLLTATEQDLTLRVATAYFDVLLAEFNVRLAQSLKTAFSEQLEQAKRSFEVGTATIVDTYEAQSRYDLATSQEIAALNDLEVKQRALQAITGKTYASLKSFADKVPLVTPDPNSMDYWVEKAESSSLAVAAQQQALEVARKEIDRNRAGHYPTLDLVANYSDRPVLTQLGVGPNTKSTTIGVQIAIPIFQGFGQESRVKEAVALEDRARSDLESARRNASLAAKQAFLGVNSGVAQARALEQALVSSQSQLESTKLGREVGVRTTVDVLNAEQQLISTRRDLAQAYYNYLLSHLRLEAAAGTLDEEDVLRINRALK